METSKELITYKVVFLDEDETTIWEGPITLNQGAPIIPPSQEPSKSPDDEWEYFFCGWIDQYGNKLVEYSLISENLIYKAYYGKKPHNYKRLLIKKANCTEDGYEEIICTQCSHKRIKIIFPKRGHNWKQEIKKEPTCLEDGLKKCTCMNKESSYYEACNAVEENVSIPALGHQCKVSNIARSESALRRGATFTCVHEGCDYSYTLCFQSDKDTGGIGEMPSVVRGDNDRWVGDSILHIGADISTAQVKEITKNQKKGIHLSSGGGG